MGLLDRLLGRQFLVDENSRLRREIRSLRKRQDESSGSENQMASISGLHAHIMQLSEDGIVHYANSAMCSCLGKDKAEVIGKSIEEVDHMPWGSGEIAEIIRRRKGRGPFDHQELRDFIDPETGNRFYYQVRVNGKDGRFQILVEDVTDLKSLEETFKRYVSPNVIEKMKNLSQDFFRPERYEMTVLFADLRGFTSLSEKLPPDHVRRMLNDWLHVMTEILQDHEATIDKFVGDGVMALFGAPIFMEDHAERAISVAVAMQEAHATLCGRWESKGQKSVPMGVGINTGEMVIGNIGSASRMEYTVLGHSVNLAHRMCDLAGGGEIVIGGDTLSRMRGRGADVLHRVSVEGCDPVQLKGVRDSVEVFQVVAR